MRFRKTLTAGSLWLATFTSPSRAQTAPNNQVLTFAQAVTLAQSASHQRDIAEKQYLAASARHGSALANMGPHASANYMADNFDQAVTATMGPMHFTVRPQQLRDASVTVAQPIVGLYTEFEKAGLQRTDEDAAAAGLELATRDAAFTVGEAYRRAQQAEEMVRISAASVVATKSQEKDAQAMVASGQLIQSDLLKIRMSRLEAEAQLAKTQAGRDKAYEGLRLALGLDDNTPINLEPFPSAATVQNFKAPDLASALSQSQRTSLEVQRAQLGAEKAGYAARMTHMKFLPEVNVFASWDRYYGTPPFGTPPFTRTFGVKASWDLWDNGSRLFAESEASAQRQQAESAVAATKDKVHNDVFAVLADLQAAQESLAAAQAMVTQAEEAYRLDQARFRNGLLTATDLVISEASQTRARGTLVSAVADVDVLIQRLERTLGERTPRPSA